MTKSEFIKVITRVENDLHSKFYPQADIDERMSFIQDFINKAWPLQTIIIIPNKTYIKQTP